MCVFVCVIEWEKGLCTCLWQSADIILTFIHQIVLPANEIWSDSNRSNFLSEISDNFFFNAATFNYKYCISETRLHTNPEWSFSPNFAFGFICIHFHSLIIIIIVLSIIIFSDSWGVPRPGCVYNPSSVLWVSLSRLYWLLCKGVLAFRYLVSLSRTNGWIETPCEGLSFPSKI